VVARRSRRRIPQLRPKVVAAPTDATFFLVEVPRHLEGKWGGRPRHIDKGKNWRSCLRAWIFPAHFPGFSFVWYLGTYLVVRHAPVQRHKDQRTTGPQLIGSHMTDVPPPPEVWEFFATCATFNFQTINRFNYTGAGSYVLDYDHVDGRCSTSPPVRRRK
jgi:hypothetical protein